MIAARKIWSIIQEFVPKGQWVSSKDIYTIVESHCKLDEEDRQSPAPLSRTPKWKLLVRDVLLERLKKGKARSRVKTK